MKNLIARLEALEKARGAEKRYVICFGKEDVEAAKAENPSDVVLIDFGSIDPSKI